MFSVNIIHYILYKFTILYNTHYIKLISITNPVHTK